MARRRVIWHIGPVDPGTGFLDAALAAGRAEFAELGLGVPTGRWHEIENQIWKHKGTSLISTAGAARAGTEEIALRLAGLRDAELHLVLVLRDLRHQVYSAWQDAIAHGASTPLRTFAERVLDPARSHWQAEEFWAGRDLKRILDQWTRHFRADRVHVATCDPGPDAVWDRFLEVAGVPAADRPPRPATLVPPTLPAAIDPDAARDLAEEWGKFVADRGHQLHGSLQALPGSTAGAPGEPAQWEALTELLAGTAAESRRLTAEVGRLRVENDRLDRKRRKHKRRVAALKARLDEA